MQKLLYLYYILQFGCFWRLLSWAPCQSSWQGNCICRVSASRRHLYKSKYLVLTVPLLFILSSSCTPNPSRQVSSVSKPAFLSTSSNDNRSLRSFCIPLYLLLRLLKHLLGALEIVPLDDSHAWVSRDVQSSARGLSIDRIVIFIQTRHTTNQREIRVHCPFNTLHLYSVCFAAGPYRQACARLRY